jgi:hypothetical protein
MNQEVLEGSILIPAGQESVLVIFMKAYMDYKVKAFACSYKDKVYACS